MKKTWIVIGLSLCLGFTTTSCDTLSQLPIGSLTGEPSDLEIGNGLKEALNNGIGAGVKTLMQTDGYFANQALKILLPPEAQQVQNLIIKHVPGGQKLIDAAVLKMNRAAEDAAKEALPIFTNAITNMSIVDARNILFGGAGAATNFLKQKTLQSLTQAYAPKINASLSGVGAIQAWDALVTPYNKLANSPAGLLIDGLKPINSDLGSYVTQRALDGLFLKVTEKENSIRANVAERTSQLLQKVFGLLDKKQ
jgi:hypothetical protein